MNAMDMNQQTKVDIWEKWDWLWQAMFYLAVLISFGLTLRASNLTQPIWLVTLLTGITILWHSIGMKLAYRNMISWEKYPTPRFIVLIGDCVLWFVLVNLSPTYYVTLFGLFVQTFRHLPIRYATITVLILTVLMMLEQAIDAGSSFSLANPNNWLFSFAGLASIGIGIWISAIIDQSTQRRELIEQLESTRSELAAAERREGILEERQRLAREIHDTLAQGFTSIVMHLEAAEQALPDDLNILQKHLNQARTTARNSLDQARRVVQDLRPELLEQQTLPNAIERTAKRWTEETDIPTVMQTTGQVLPTHPSIEVMLLRATQEALNNIRKHAQATDVQITLSYISDVIMLDIQDNGVGLDDAKPSPYSSGYGLLAMRERAEQCGGTVILESDPDEGTTVVITVPLSEDTKHNQIDAS